MHRRSKKILAAMAGGVGTLSIAGMPLSVLASPNQSSHDSNQYKAHLQQLNGSGATGQAQLHYYPGQNDSEDSKLHVTVDANGLTPDQIHPVHIHGKDNPEIALCPANEADINKDGFISVVEGAPAYGPIKMNLTSPQTPFGASPSPALFTEFAGTPDISNFPMASGDGTISQDEEYIFSQSENDQGALESLIPFEDQHIVVHGGFAPASVDADAFAALGMPVTGDLSAVSYDALLPVACGEIEKVSNEQIVTPPTPVVDNHTERNVSAFDEKANDLKQEFTEAQQSARDEYDSSSNGNGTNRDNYVATTQKARDHYLNKLYETRNHLVDQLNRRGETELRNSILTQLDHDIEEFSRSFETTKHEFLANAQQ